MLTKIVFYVVFFIPALSVYSQNDLDFGDTEKTNKTPTYESDPDKFKDNKRITFILKKSQKGLLIGNKCLEDYTFSKGYVFLLQSKNSSGRYDNWKRVFHNIGAKFILIFKVGPHWKLAWKKKRRDCRYGLHDFVG